MISSKNKSLRKNESSALRVQKALNIAYQEVVKENARFGLPMIGTRKRISSHKSK